jgi:hypothetical protein
MEATARRWATNKRSEEMNELNQIQIGLDVPCLDKFHWEFLTAH